MKAGHHEHEAEDKTKFAASCMRSARAGGNVSPRTGSDDPVSRRHKHPNECEPALISGAWENTEVFIVRHFVLLTHGRPGPIDDVSIAASVGPLDRRNPIG